MEERNAPRQQHQHDPEPNAMEPPPERPLLTTKLILIACLGGLALLMGCLCVVVQLQIKQAHQRLLFQSNVQAGSNQAQTRTKAQATSDPTSLNDLYLSQQPHTLPHTGSSRLTAATAYWNQFLGVSPAKQTAPTWNPVLQDSTNSFDLFRRPANQDYDLMSNRSLAEHKYYALQQAAQLGHPQAQHVYANALASGVLPFGSQPMHLEVADDFFHTHSHQQQEAWLTWHMAAMSGHVESAMALAHRYETQRQRSDALAGAKKRTAGQGKDASSAASGLSFQCNDVLPYYQAAAHGVMDSLEVDPNSRAKVPPPSEKHLLYTVHLHGGTSSQLDWNNKPDESMEALQFYHFKATRSLDPDPGAAMTLATLYHHGYRGVPQNLTMALFYYDIAAEAGSWEAAGYAGWFHVFGMGMSPQQRDLYKAHKYFRQGIIGGLTGCKERHNKKKRFKQTDSVVQCESSCLNGMGLLHVFGVPLVAEVDLDEATEYFTLAKDMGHADAAYNLAMLTLGWKRSYMSTDDALKLKEDYDLAKARKKQKESENVDIDSSTSESSTTHAGLPDFMQQPWSTQEGPTQLELQHVVQYLMIAVQKGHLQARHRLAMLYETGILSPPSDKNKARRHGDARRKNEVLPQDCDKALKHYKALVEGASPSVLHRLRQAYKDYMSGDLETSLIQYMSIAELGNEVAQVNAAFLMEQGVCIGLSTTDCHKASVRYWKAAAAVGNAEACLRVGDFYYYGKLRPPQDPLTALWDRPFGFFQYLIFPEKYWIPALSSLVHSVIQEVVHGILTWTDPAGGFMGSHSEDDTEEELDGSCSTDGSCSADLNDGAAAPDEEDQDNSHHLTTTQKEQDELDLSMAAHYYRIAAEKHLSSRANFNLGFLHEWGLGLKQDFPLAKRHYDLAVSSLANSREADLASQIALWSLSLHEYFVRLVVAWEDYLERKSGDSAINEASTTEKQTSKLIETLSKTITGMLVSGYRADHSTSDTTQARRKSKTDIILFHLFSWESLLILCLTLVLWVLLQLRRQRTRR